MAGNKKTLWAMTFLLMFSGFSLYSMKRTPLEGYQSEKKQKVEEWKARLDSRRDYYKDIFSEYACKNLVDILTPLELDKDDKLQEEQLTEAISKVFDGASIHAAELILALAADPRLGVPDKILMQIIKALCNKTWGFGWGDNRRFDDPIKDEVLTCLFRNVRKGEKFSEPMNQLKALWERKLPLGDLSVPIRKEVIPLGESVVDDRDHCFVAVDPDGGRFLTVLRETIVCGSLADGGRKKVDIRPQKKKDISHLTYSTDGKLFALVTCATQSLSAIFYNGSHKSQVQIIGVDGHDILSIPLDGKITRLVWHPKGECFAVVRGYNQITICDSRSGKIIFDKDMSVWVSALSFTPDGQVAFGLANGVAGVIDLVSGECKSFSEGGERVVSIAVSNDNKTLVIARSDKMCQIFDRATGAFIRQIVGAGTRVKFSRDNTMLLAYKELSYEPIRIFKIPQYTCTWAVKDSGLVAEVFFSSDDASLIGIYEGTLIPDEYHSYGPAIVRTQLRASGTYKEYVASILKETNDVAERMVAEIDMVGDWRYGYLLKESDEYWERVSCNALENNLKNIKEKLAKIVLSKKSGEA